MLTGLAQCLVLEKATKIPEGWSLEEQPVDAAQPLRLSIALREPRMQDLEPLIVDSRTSFLTREETQTLRRPEDEDVAAVQKWLAGYGIASTHQDDWIKVQTTAHEAEELLNMKFGHYSFEGKAPVLRTREYSVPDDLAEVISFIHPVTNFMTPKTELSHLSPPRDKVRRDDVPCADQTTPDCIRELYNIPPPKTNSTSSAVRLGIAGFLEQYANYLDVEVFLKRTAKSIAETGYNFTIEKVNGGGDTQNPMKSGLEAQLDLEYAMAIGYPSNVIFYSVGGRGVQLNDTGKPLPEEDSSNEPYLEFLDYLLAKEDDEIPHVLSFSYADDELSVPRPYAERVCSMLGLLTARGTTIVAGSGDGGAAGAQNSSCQKADGKPVTMAVFPASCPWVTAVGAVRNDVDPPEGATFSGGGFSQYFKRPLWQNDAVEGYVKSLDGYLSEYYNASMRATPDISAVGTEFDVTVALQKFKLDGTSASTPVVAAMLALIDEDRFKAGKKALGWINQRLYNDTVVQESIRDVTDGTSASCDFEEEGKPGGWTSAEGWDAITGLGVPRDFPKFRDALYHDD